MAIYYVDPYDGNDANDGASWASAKKTIELYGSTADETRVAKSPVIDTGISAAFTHNTSVVDTSTPVGKAVDQATGNTWSSGITGVTLGTYYTRRIGANSQQITLASTFSGGKAAYKTLPDVEDFSMFENLCLFVSGSNLSFFNSWNPRICLCSDTEGNSIVDELPLGTLYQTNQYMHAVVINKPGGFGSSIRSIALYVDNATSTLYIRLNAIYATNGFTNQTLISSSNGPLSNQCEIVFIDGTEITLGCRYVDETGGFNVFSTLPAIVMSSGASTGAIPLARDYVSLTGGYDKSSNEITGITWLHGRVGIGTGFSHTNRKLTISNFGFCYYLHPPIAGYRITGLTNIYAISCSGNNGVLQANYCENIRLISCGKVSINQVYEFYDFFACACGTITVQRGDLPIPSYYKNITVIQSTSFEVSPGTYHFVFVNISLHTTPFQLQELSCTYNNFFGDATNYEAHGNFINSMLLVADNQKKPRFANQFCIEGEQGNNRTNRFSGYLYQQEFMAWGDSPIVYPDKPGRWSASCNSTLDYFTLALPVPYRLIEYPVTPGAPVIFKIRLHYASQPPARLIIRSALNHCVDEDIIVNVPAVSVLGEWIQVPIYVNPVRAGVLLLELQLLNATVLVSDIEIVS